MPPSQPVFGKTDLTDRSKRISGPNSTGSTPISVSKVNPSTANPKVPLPRAAATFGGVRRDGANDVKDQTVNRAAFQNNGTAAQPGATQPPGGQPERREPLSPVPNRLIPNPSSGPPIETPALNLNQIEEVGKMTTQQAAELSGVLVPKVPLWPPERGYGYPKGSRPYRINMQQAWLLAIMNARFYQYNLKTVYEAALPVTLQRFTFDPQFLCGTFALDFGSPNVWNGFGECGIPVDTWSDYEQYLYICDSLRSERGDLLLELGNGCWRWQAVQLGWSACGGIRERDHVQLPWQELEPAERDLGPADQLRAAAPERWRPGCDPGTAHAS